MLTAPPVIPAAARRPVPPTAQLVVLLQSIRSYPCLTLLLNTEPAATVRGAGAARLRALLDSAARRLCAEGSTASTRCWRRRSGW